MRLILDPMEDVAHGEWLRTERGAYEWWYFDALSDDGQWALACIWFLGNPFSPYYRMAARGVGADPFDHNAVFFALYRDGELYAYHFTRFPVGEVWADEGRPATLRFGPNVLGFDGGEYRLSLRDVNANGRGMAAELRFAAPALVTGGDPLPGPPPNGGGESEGGRSGGGGGHFWLPAAPSCRVGGEIVLTEAQNGGAERVAFAGEGYHDHNWGTLPFDAQIRDWYWARVGLGGGRAVVLYHTRYHQGAVSHLLEFDGGRLVRHDDQARVTLGRVRVNGFGTAYATELTAQSGDLSVVVTLGRRLDSAPFYVRALCEGVVTEGGRRVERGRGMGEYLRPRMLSWPIVASATKARIVER